MKTLAALCATGWIVAVAVAGAPPTHEEVVKKMVGALDDLNKTLATITSQETADTSKPELRKIAKDWVALRTQAEKLPPPPREEKDRLDKEYKGKLEAAQKKLVGEVARVQNIPGGPDALKEIRSVLARQMK